MTVVVDLSGRSEGRLFQPGEGRSLGGCHEEVCDRFGFGRLPSAVPAHAAKMCVDIREIDSSKSKDGRIMVFKMKDGSTLVNHLQGFCPDLKYHGLRLADASRRHQCLRE